MSLPNDHKLADAVRGGRLTADQEAELEARLRHHPEERDLWEEELALNQLLQNVRDVPVSSNFTSRVLQAITTSPAPSRHRFPARFTTWRRYLNWLRAPQITAVAAVCCVCLGLYRQNQMSARREYARHIAELSKVASVAPLDVLQNFEAIERLNQVPRDVERELIAALQ